MPGKPITKPDTGDLKVRCDCCKKDENEMYPGGLESMLFPGEEVKHP
jgi:hypothetical protein